MTHFFAEPPPEDPAPADSRLARRVAAALTGHDGVTVDVQNGVVILTGTVGDARSHDAVLGRVREMGEARDLCDGLTVRDGRSGPGREAELFGELAARLAVRPPPRKAWRAPMAVAARAAVVTTTVTVVFAVGILALIADILLRARGR
ncbi:BON domain-containing protein [Paractinoplanes atraurantiacus]|uniref:BON domain-containing protein n=1 Tax=Paractinoplanes atraurantiacus TaxID=1036182 RepID=A0A285KAD7_9ACTN|nr:BON domain-containing protein [Actinoplanes atraurantiacus]SNY68927.1 BON domain-containing protein [Actinoplanes atraurantiacus]